MRKTKDITIVISRSITGFWTALPNVSLAHWSIKPVMAGERSQIIKIVWTDSHLNYV
jgi:hypothetical protein